MKKRLNWIGRQFIFWVAAFLVVFTFPIWIILWVITGENVIEILKRFQDPEFWVGIDEMNADTAKKLEENKKWAEEMRKTLREWKENNDGTYSSHPIK